MWASVKVETESDRMALGTAVCWRPAYINGESSASGPNRPKLLQVLRPVFRLLKPIRSMYVESQEIGWTMLQAANEGLRGRVIENAEIRERASLYDK
ncbi:MAG TPA: hypothetical protein VGB07_30990 [Blastocatellia bacterium]